MKSVDLMSLWNAVCSVLLCFSVRERTIARLVEEFFSHRTHRFNRTFWRTVSNSKDSGPSPNPSPAGRGVVCEVTPTGLLTRFLGRFFSHRTHRFNRTFWRTVSNSQNASGIQISQNVTAKGGCWVMSVRC